MAETVTWIDPDGIETILAVEWDVAGRFSPPTRFEEEGIPDQDGMRLRAVHHDARDFVLPLWIEGSSEADLRTKMRNLVSSMNPLRGDGRIRVTSPVGDQREIVCRAASGLEMGERLNETSGPEVQRAAVVFRAWEPYWQESTDSVSGPWTVGGSPGSFFPIFPLRLASSEVFASVSVVNSGDVDAWPVWTITGPGANPRLRNLTTGKDFYLPLYTIQEGEVVTIDTRPTGSTRKTVTSSTVGNLYGKLSGTTALWPFAPGTNAVSIEMGAATSATSIQVARRHRYLAV